MTSDLAPPVDERADPTGYADPAGYEAPKLTLLGSLFELTEGAYHGAHPDAIGLTMRFSA
jgi:hypothetical protein